MFRDQQIKDLGETIHSWQKASEDLSCCDANRDQPQNESIAQQAINDIIEILEALVPKYEEISLGGLTFNKI